MFRRFLGGFYPLLVWAEDDEAADRTAAVHGLALRFEVVSLAPFDPSDLELEP